VVAGKKGLMVFLTRKLNFQPILEETLRKHHGELEKPICGLKKKSKNTSQNSKST
jgi:hypothetical protein